MEIRNITNFQNIQFRQNENKSSVTSDAIKNTPEYQPINTQALKAYVTPQIKPSYEKIQTFNLPYIGSGEAFTLSNGHKIILIPKAGHTSIHTSVGVGEADEPQNLKSGTHLLEHLLSSYNASPKTDIEKDSQAQTGAFSNAATGNQSTEYYIHASVTTPEEFEQLIKIQSQVLQNKDFSEEAIEAEKKIILEEEGTKDVPVNDLHLADSMTKKNLFNIQLTQKDGFKDIKKEDLVNYYNKFYRPDNMVTTVVGSVDKDSIKTIAKYFNYPTLQAKKPLRKQILPSDYIQKSIRTDINSDKNNDKTYLTVGFIGPESSDRKGNCVADVLSWVINRRLRKETDSYLHSDVDSVYPDKTSPMIFQIKGESSEENLENDLQKINSTIKDLKQNPISNEELQKIKNTMKSDWTYFAEDTDVLANVCSEVAMTAQSLDKTKGFELLETITAEDVQNAAKKYLDTEKSSTVIIHPKDASARAQNVSFSSNPHHLNNEDIQEYTLSNNLRVVIDSRPGIARSTVEIHLKSQELQNPKNNVAATLSELLQETANKKDFRNKDIDAAVFAGPQEMCISLNSDSDKIKESLNSAIDILLNPDFSAKRFTEVKTTLNELFLGQMPSLEKTSRILSEGNPYRTNLGLNPAMQLNDTKGLYNQILHNAQGSVFITIPKEKLAENQQEILSILTKMPTLKPYDSNKSFDKAKFMPIAKTQVFLEPKDDKRLEIKRIYKLKCGDEAQNRVNILALNTALGITDDSKLYQHLRKEEKLSYYPHSEIAGSQDGSMTIALVTQVSETNNAILKIVKAYDKSIDELATTPLAPRELKRIKGIMKNSQLSQLEKSSTRNQLNINGYDTTYGLDYEKAIMTAIDNISAEDIQKLAQKLQKEKYLLSISGDKGAIDANREYLSSFGEIQE